MGMEQMTRKALIVASLIVLACGASACVGEDPGPTNGSESNLDAKTDADIHVVRDPNAPSHPAYGTKVAVSGIVTGVKNAGPTHGFFIQDPGEPAWGAIYVYAGAGKIELQPGTVVRVTGFYISFRGLDEIDVTDGTQSSIERTGTAPIPAPLEVDVAEIANGGPRAAELQSVSLLVRGVTATRATAGVDFAVRGSNAEAELVVTSYWASDMSPPVVRADLNQRFASIRGFGIRFGANEASAVAKLAPIAPTDAVAE